MQIKCQLRELTSIEKLRNHLLSVVLKNASEEVETGNIGQYQLEIRDHHHFYAVKKIVKTKVKTENITEKLFPTGIQFTVCGQNAILQLTGQNNI